MPAGDIAVTNLDYRFNQGMAIELLEKVGIAALILVVTWLLARAAKWAFAKLVDKVAFFRRKAGGGTTLGASLGRIVALLIWLFGLLAVLTVLGLGTVAGPINTLLVNVVEYIPRLIGAGLIFFIGMVVARIVRDLIETSLQTVDFDKWVNRGGGESVTGSKALSRTIATIAYAIIVILVAIMALDALAIESISRPASGMLRLIFAAIPNIIAAAILLGIGYLVGRFVAQMLKDVLPGLGVDRALSDSGLVTGATSASTVLARVAQIAIVLVFAVAATRQLGFPEVTQILENILELGGRVIVGAVVIAAGFFLGGLLARLIAGDAGSSAAGAVVRWLTVVLFVFMGLDFMGIGGMIPANALTLLVGGVAVAGALAFGLGGRDWAAKKLEQMDRAADASPSGSAPPSAQTASASQRSPRNPQTSGGTTGQPLPPGA